MVGELYISNITSESFSISWNGTEGEFDGFTLEVIDSDWLTEQKEYNVSRGVESLEVTGLRPGTDYVAYVSGTYKGSRTSPVSIVASTGISKAWGHLLEHLQRGPGSGLQARRMKRILYLSLPPSHL